MIVPQKGEFEFFRAHIPAPDLDSGLASQYSTTFTAAFPCSETPISLEMATTSIIAGMQDYLGRHSRIDAPSELEGFPSFINIEPLAEAESGAIRKVAGNWPAFSLGEVSCHLFMDQIVTPESEKIAAAEAPSEPQEEKLFDLDEAA